MGNILHLNLESLFRLFTIHSANAEQTKSENKNGKKFITMNILTKQFFFSVYILFSLRHFFLVLFSFRSMGIWCVFRVFDRVFFGHKNENHFKYLFYPNEWTAWTCNTSICSICSICLFPPLVPLVFNDRNMDLKL